MNDYKQINTRFVVKEMDQTGSIEGYGSVFGIEDKGGDVVMPGAFKDTIKMHRKNGTTPKMLWQHDPGKPIGRWTDLKEDERGLQVKGKLLVDSDPLARTAHAHLQEKTIDGLSIGFVVDDYEIRKKDKVREIKAVDLWEVSVVTFAMNPQARVENVKQRDLIKTRKDFEATLRNVMGLSAAEAKKVASLGYAGLQRNVASDEVCQYLNLLKESIHGYRS